MKPKAKPDCELLPIAGTNLSDRIRDLGIDFVNRAGIFGTAGAIFFLMIILKTVSLSVFLFEAYSDGYCTPIEYCILLLLCHIILLVCLFYLVIYLDKALGFKLVRYNGN